MCVCLSSSLLIFPPLTITALFLFLRCRLIVSPLFHLLPNCLSFFLPVRPPVLSPLSSVIGQMSRRRCWQSTRPGAQTIVRREAARLPCSSRAVRNSSHACCHYLLELLLSLFFPLFLSQPRRRVAGLYTEGGCKIFVGCKKYQLMGEQAHVEPHLTSVCCVASGLASSLQQKCCFFTTEPPSIYT